jgi:polysaccharide biosynthesis protein PslG
MLRAGAASVVLFALVAAATPASGRVPHDFVGMFPETRLLERAGVADQEYDAMVRAGVGSVRDVLSWESAQPYATWDQVPESQRSLFRDENGVPTDWRESDRIVGRAVQRRMRMLPVVLVTPPWAARTPGNEVTSPSDPAAYARFMDSLVDRYGPAGTLWAERPDLPRLPIRDWHIWNEPHFSFHWFEQPYVHDYVALLRAAHAAIKAADPGARVVLAGLANVSWRFLADLYRAGARPYFDAFAVHPYTRKVAGIIEILRRNRRVARRFGDARKPLMVTEMGWNSGLGQLRELIGWDATERGQAAKLRKALPLLARERRRLGIESVYWYTWLSRDSNRDAPFDYAGLNRIERGGVVRKPGFYALRAAALRLVGCRRKAGRADRCAR